MLLRDSSKFKICGIQDLLTSYSSLLTCVLSSKAKVSKRIHQQRSEKSSAFKKKWLHICAMWNVAYDINCWMSIAEEERGLN